MRRLPLIAALVILSAFLPESLGAQATLRGVLIDSLRSGGPVEGASVVLMGANRRATTERGGRFEFSDLAPGQYTVAYWAPWLDSLGLPALQRQVELRGSRTETITLSTPSPATVQRAVCGDVLSDEQSILIGEVRDSDGNPGAGVGVFARWLETVIQGREVAQGTMAAADTATAAGSYVLCGVPLNDEFTLRAVGARGVGSGELLVKAGASIARRDIVVGAAGATLRVTGRVVRENGEPIIGATVLVAGDSSQSVRSDSSGRFALPTMARRSSQLIVRSLGYVPLVRSIDPFDAQLDLDDVQLEPAPRELATVTITGEAMTASQAQFEARRERAAGGVFVDEARLKELGVVSSVNIATTNPRVAVQNTRNGPMLMMRRGSEFCRPRFFIDGYDFRDITADEENSFLRVAKRVEMYTANNAPSQFNDFNGCGAIVIWTY
ncbi:MAG: hypothetical protein C0503_02150 [Gemmatimonas sp.]|nr:hypothetical protein [Gemmatimonas sp.]